MQPTMPGPAGSLDQSAASPARHAGTPQRKKLGIRPGSTFALWNPPSGWTLADAIDDVTRCPADGGESSIDLVLAFVHTPADLATVAGTLPARIFPAGSLWIAWPRKAAGHLSDITEQMLRDVQLPLGIVDTKVAAIDHDWSGLKFVWRKEFRKASYSPT
ncbi:MAG: hypothetical protein QM589_15485 [Thermomicrobiales bacterium]